MKYALSYYWNETRYAVRNFIPNLRRCWRISKVYWGTCDSDWSSIAVVLRYQIREVREHIARHNIIMHADRYCRQMRITEECLTRMLEGTGAEEAGKRYPEHNKAWADQIRDIEKQEMEIFLANIKYMQHWWD